MADSQVKTVVQAVGAAIDWSRWCGRSVWGMQSMVDDWGDGTKSVECKSCSSGPWSQLTLMSF